MKVLLLGTGKESDMELADAIGDSVTLVTFVKDAQRFMRRNRVVAVVVTRSDDDAMAFVENQVLALSAYGSVLDVVILVGYNRDSYGPTPQGVMMCSAEIVPGVITEALADAEEHDPNRPGRSEYSREKSH